MRKNDEVINKCSLCGSLYDEPERGELDLETGWRHWLCPYCHGEVDAEPMIRCGRCGEWMPSDGEQEILCDKCVYTADKKLLRFIDSLDEDERDYIDYALDGNSVSDWADLASKRDKDIYDVLHRIRELNARKQSGREYILDVYKGVGNTPDVFVRVHYKGKYGTLKADKNAVFGGAYFSHNAKEMARLLEMIDEEELDAE